MMENFDLICFFFAITRRLPSSTLFPYTTLFRSSSRAAPPKLKPTQTPPCPVRREPLVDVRSEEHTSELQSRVDLVCRLLLEKKNAMQNKRTHFDCISWSTLSGSVTSHPPVNLTR